MSAANVLPTSVVTTASAAPGPPPRTPSVPSQPAAVPGLLSTSAVLPSVPAPATASFPAHFLGSVNPTAARRFFASLADPLSTGAVGTTPKLWTYDLRTTTKFKTRTKGWSVVQVAGLNVHLYPLASAKDHYIILHWCWVPAGEDVPTNLDDMEDFQTFGRLHLFPVVAGSVPPGTNFICPIGSAELAGNVKPAPVSGGFPQLVVAVTATKKDGTSADAASLASVAFEYQLKLGV